MDEVWKSAPGWEGRYEVSSEGRVRSLGRYVTRTSVNGEQSSYFKPGQLLATNFINSGYLAVHLYRDGERQVALVHRLVVRAFLGEPTPDKPEVNHLNFDRLDNRLANLEWCDRQRNVDHSADRRSLQGNRVVAVPVTGLVGYFFPSQSVAEKTLLGKLTGSVSWSLKTGRPCLGFEWGRV